jgi:LacI family repressor for deo operon, udp, cdd, tsx, nupC, and nupG
VPSPGPLWTMIWMIWAQPMKVNATIEDVARLAAVSIATVSRTIHFPDKVAKSTRQKVNHAIAVTGYTANALARGLRTGKLNLVLVVVPDISDPNVASILIGLENVARRNGFGVLIGHTQNEPERGLDYIKYFSSNRAAGMILLTGLAPAASAGAEEQIPLSVGALEPIANGNIAYVGVDDVAGARKAVDLLLAEGHRSIAFVGSNPEKLSFARRLEGYRQSLEASGLAVPSHLVLEGDGTIESGRVAVEQLFIRDTLPTAFMCANDQMAAGVMIGLAARGYDIPNDFSVVGFDDIPQSGFIVPSLTTVRQPRTMIGETAMQTLLGQLKSVQPEQLEQLFVPELVIRNSVASPRGTLRKA